MEKKGTLRADRKERLLEVLSTHVLIRNRTHCVFIAPQVGMLVPLCKTGKSLVNRVKVALHLQGSGHRPTVKLKESIVRFMWC